MEAFKADDIFMVLGRRRCGKSHLAARISAAYPRKVIIDTLCEYGAKDGIICTSFEDFTQKIGIFKNATNFKIVLRYNIESKDVISEFNQTLRILWHFKNVLIHIEEIQRFCTSHKMPKWLEENLTTGGHQKNAMLFTSQMPKLCHKALISSSAHVFCGSLHETNDLKYVRGFFGKHSDEILKLPIREFLYLRPGFPILHITNDFALKRELV